MQNRLIDVQGLTTRFFTEEGMATAVDGISFHIDTGETLGMVGESGCGKSVTALSIMRLVADPPGRITNGKVLVDGQDLLSKGEAEMRTIRGNSISMIFQEPMTSLNPVYTVGEQIAEAVRLHQGKGRAEAWEQAVSMLNLVGIPLPRRRAVEFPHQLSGGMRQRVMIAMALSCNPKLLIADEPTTALDVTIQAQILDLMQRLKEEFGMAILLITHDLGVVAEVARRVIVMYAGKMVEEALVEDLFSEPLHPYTAGLMKSIPRLDTEGRQKLHVIDGTVPNLLRLPPGCAFGPRCPQAIERCRVEEPEMAVLGNGRKVSCWLAGHRTRQGVA